MPGTGLKELQCPLQACQGPSAGKGWRGLSEATRSSEALGRKALLAQDVPAHRTVQKERKDTQAGLSSPRTPRIRWVCPTGPLTNAFILPELSPKAGGGGTGLTLHSATLFCLKPMRRGLRLFPSLDRVRVTLSLVVGFAGRTP